MNILQNKHYYTAAILELFEKMLSQQFFIFESVSVQKSQDNVGRTHCFAKQTSRSQAICKIIFCSRQSSINLVIS